MISTLSSALSMQSSSHTDMDRLSSKRRFVNLDLDRSRASRHRHRVLSSARKMAALFHHEIKARQSRKQFHPLCAVVSNRVPFVQ
jgi:hypothetical protein